MAAVGPPADIKVLQEAEMAKTTPTAVKQNAKFITGPVNPRSAGGQGEVSGKLCCSALATRVKAGLVADA